MVLASEVKEGTALQLDGKIWKVLEVVRHAGSGQMHGFIEMSGSATLPIGVSSTPISLTTLS